MHAAHIQEVVDQFFKDCPCSGDGLADQVDAFLEHHRELTSSRLKKPVAVVTSGGTTVPLEQHCVRFIDNFSGGTRGALSTEQLLEAGYVVIFLTRKYSIQPFTKGLPGSEVFDCLTQVFTWENGGTGSGIGLNKEASVLVQDAVRQLSHCNEQHTLLRIHFTTLFEYLKYLQILGQCLGKYNSQVMFYLAAAVSDFYLPWSSMAEHKIQSDQGTLHLELPKVPKMLGILRSTWAPGAFVVSFKLETDPSILIEKASRSIARYNVHVVVANILDTRKDEVWLVSQSAQGGITVKHVQRKKSELFIEKQLIQALVELHKDIQTLS